MYIYICIYIYIYTYISLYIYMYTYIGNIHVFMCAGAMGILLVYDVTDEQTFNNIRNWMRQIQQHVRVDVVCCHGGCSHLTISAIECAKSSSLRVLF